MAATNPRIARGRVVLVLSLLGLLLAPASALGHAAFLDSQPAPGERLGSSPAEIRLEFTEPLDRSLSEATLVNLDTGESAPAEVSSGSEKEVVLRPQAPMPRAPYRVDWQTVSTVDGHTLAGTFGFGVQTAAVGAEHDVEQSPLARDGWLRIGGRALLYACLLFFAGGVLTAALLTRRPDDPAAWLLPERKPDRTEDSERAQSLWRRTIDAGWLAASAAATVAVLEAGDASGGLGLGGMTDFLLSNTAGLARVATVATIVVAVLLADARMRFASATWVALAFLTIALSGHANSADLRGLAVTTDWIHLIAGAIWIGGIAQIAWAWLPALWRRSTQMRMAVMRSVLRRFGRLALPAFVVVAASGSLNAIAQLGRVDALWETAYGRVLAVKIGLVALIALASYFHALRLRPALLAANPHPSPKLERRHWRLLGAEPWLGLGAIAAVAALVAFPLPPKQLGESDEAEAAAAACDPCPLPRASSGELPVAEQAGSRIAAFWLRREPGALSGTLRVYDYNARPVETEVGIAGAELDSCDAGCWRFTAPDPGHELTAIVADQGRQYDVTVPSRWSEPRSAQAERLLREAQARMRRLETLRIRESVTSGPRVLIRTRYRLEAPDRMAYKSSTGTDLIAIGRTAYDIASDGQVERRPFGADGFHLDQLFRWSVYGRSVRWLGSANGVTRIALFDPASPIWYRLEIDRETKRIVRERMITGGHYMTRRYFAFDQPLDLKAPR
ncbi:MAG: copper resistance CopC/CopD family protein [Solirubrobacterales bacterium]